LLVEHFLEEISKSRGVDPPRLDSATMDRLTSHDWPGNVRELKNAIERALLLSAVRPGAKLEIQGLEQRRGSSERRPQVHFDPALSFSESKERWLDDRERAYVAWLIGSHEGNVSAAARGARMDRKYLHKLIKKHGL